MVNADHISVRDEQKLAEQQDLGIEGEIAANSLVDHSNPLFGADLSRGIETYTIAPKMWHSPHLVSKFI